MVGKIQINFTNKWLYTFALIIGIFALGVGVYAASHPNPGHTISEVDFSGTIAILNANQICLSGDCQTTWPGGGSSGPAGYRSNTGISCTDSDDALIAERWFSPQSSTNCPPSTCTESNKWLPSGETTLACERYSCPSGPDFPCTGGVGCILDTNPYIVTAVACVGDA